MMVSKTDQILDDMRKCTPPEKIDDSSKSGYYKAYTIWKPEANATYKKISNDIQTAQSQKASISNEIKKCNAELVGARNTLAQEKAELERTQATKAALKDDVNELQARSDAFESRLADLERRKITEKVIEAVAISDVTSDIELLARVKTAKDAQSLAKENEKLEANRIEFTNNVSKEAAKLEATKHETQSELNRRDEFRRINELYLALLDLLFDFFKRGYTLEHFRLLLSGLKKLEIVGQPRNSIKRLLDALEKIRTLEELDAAIQIKEATLATLQGTINELQGIIVAYRDGAVVSLNQVSTTATKKMDALLNQYLASMNTLQDRVVNNLSQMSTATQAERDTIMQFFTGEVRKAKNEVLNIHSMVTQALQMYKGEVQEWGEIRKESGRYEQLMQNTSALLAATKDPNIIKKLPPEFVVSLLRGIDVYVQVRLPDAETLPSQTLNERERMAFSSMFKAKVRNVSAWLLEDLTKRFYEGQL
jgi:archaellum component FlaC